MFVYSVKRNQIKLILTAAFVIISIFMLAALAKNDGAKPASAESRLSYDAKTKQERLAFLSQFGWQADENSEEVTEVIIPEEFDEVYASYNDIQLRQGFDLTEFSGRRVKKWTYTVTNYPGYENKICIRANLLVFNGRVIGGDICSVELDGFMHEFDMNNRDEKSTA